MILKNSWNFLFQKDWHRLIKKKNTGLIVGRSDKNVSTIIVAYRIDQETIDYAVSAQADMIISYEPIIEELFNNWKSSNIQGTCFCLQLLRHDIACYATGSSFDKCKGGSADWLASRLELLVCTSLSRRHHMQEWKIQSAKVVKDELDITKRKVT